MVKVKVRLIKKICVATCFNHPMVKVKDVFEEVSAMSNAEVSTTLW